MKNGNEKGLQALVFLLVGSAFTTIYITQPVLPVLQGEFGVSEAMASLTISSVIFGIALSNLPMGRMADRYPIRPIILSGGLTVALCGFLSAATPRIDLLIATRFIQGLSIPCLTTCLAAYLAKNLPRERLNVVMGSYVSATVAGGLGGRLLGGWIHPPLHWRYAFVSASVLVLGATLAFYLFLPREEARTGETDGAVGFLELVKNRTLLSIFFTAFSSFFVFSSVFNYLPFYLAGPAFNAPTRVITMMYLSYVIGIIIGPLAGKLSNRIGNGTTMAGGSVVFAVSVAATLIPSLGLIVLCLCGICAGFFAIHASAAGALNYRLTESRGRANSLYVLFYYLGGFSGISLSGYAWHHAGWKGVAGLGIMVLTVPFFTGIREIAASRK